MKELSPRLKTKQKTPKKLRWLLWKHQPRKQYRKLKQCYQKNNLL